MASPDTNLKSLFCEALERPGGPERDAYLEDACRGNPALKAGVEELLAAHDQAGRFLAQGPKGPVADGLETLVATGTDTPSSCHQCGGNDCGRNTRIGKNFRLGNARLRGEWVWRHERHSRRLRAEKPSWRVRAGSGHRLAVHAAKPPRRRGPGHGLPGRTVRTGQTPGRTQVDQAWHGLARFWPGSTPNARRWP